MYVHCVCVCILKFTHMRRSEVNSQALVPVFSTMWILKIILRSQILLVALFFETRVFHRSQSSMIQLDWLATESSTRIIGTCHHTQFFFFLGGGMLCVFMCWCTYMSMCVEAMLGIFLHHSPPCFTDPVSHQFGKTSWPASLLSLQHWGYRHIPPRQGFYMSAGIRLRSSCWHRKHFTHWASSPAPDSLL